MQLALTRPPVPALPALVAGLVAALLYGCASGEPARVTSRTHVSAAPAVPARPRDCCVVAAATPSQAAIGRTAAAFVGAPRIEAAGRRLRFDCSGLARGVYLTHGVDLFDGIETDDTANGVRLIYRHVSRYGRIHDGPDPRPGDLVFFHNTLDRDGDGRANDLFTHVGIVERVEADGTVLFVSHVSRGIERYRMNLAAPSRRLADDGRVLNDYMRRRRPSDPSPTRYLTGELFAGFGRLAD
jgi:hypothetical protein